MKIKLLSRNTRKTVAVSAAPPKGPAGSFLSWRPASAPFALLVAALATQGFVAHAEEWHKRWNVSAKPEFHFSAGDASIQIESGSDNVIEATVTTRGWSIGDSGVRILDHQDAGRVDLEVKVPETHFDWGNRSIEVAVRVPHSLLADVHTADGSIKIRDVGGSIRLNTSDGSISANNIDGSLDAHTSDGSIHVSGRFDNLSAHTSDGSIQLEVLKGSVVSGGWRIQSSDGGIELRLPKDISANLELRTDDGRVNLGIPLSVTGVQSEHGVQGKLNGGGNSILVRTSDGSISVGAS